MGMQRVLGWPALCGKTESLQGNFVKTLSRILCVDNLCLFQFVGTTLFELDQIHSHTSIWMNRLEEEFKVGRVAYIIVLLIFFLAFKQQIYWGVLITKSNNSLQRCAPTFSPDLLGKNDIQPCTCICCKSYYKAVVQSLRNSWNWVGFVQVCHQTVVKTVVWFSLLTKFLSFEIFCQSRFSQPTFALVD